MSPSARKRGRVGRIFSNEIASPCLTLGTLIEKVDSRHVERLIGKELFRIIDERNDEGFRRAPFFPRDFGPQFPRVRAARDHVAAENDDVFSPIRVQFPAFEEPKIRGPVEQIGIVSRLLKVLFR